MAKNIITLNSSITSVAVKLRHPTITYAGSIELCITGNFDGNSVVLFRQIRDNSGAVIHKIPIVDSISSSTPISLSSESAGNVFLHTAHEEEIVFEIASLVGSPEITIILLGLGKDG